MSRQPRPVAAVYREHKLAAAVAREVTILPDVIADLPVGLHAAQVSRAGQQRNFPQALTHPAPISAAFNLARALGA